MRRVAPSCAERPRYPRLARAWRLLAGAVALAPALASADITPPLPKQPHTGGPSNVTLRPLAPRPLAPAPRPGGDPPRPVPQLRGDMVQVAPPTPPPVPGTMVAPSPPSKPVAIHPHGPDEPCLLPSRGK